MGEFDSDASSLITKELQVKVRSHLYDLYSMTVIPKSCVSPGVSNPHSQKPNV